jgi:hypothetical protein
MKKVNLTEIPEGERRSPGGKFHARYKEISVALGRDKELARSREAAPV